MNERKRLRWFRNKQERSFLFVAGIFLWYVLCYYVIMKTILMAILAVLSVALAGVLGYQKLTQPELVPTVVSQPAVNQPVATTSDETAGWKTYRNEGYGFEVEYPGNWHVYPLIFQEIDIIGFSNLSEEEVKAKQESGDFTNARSLTIKIINKQIDSWLQEQQRLSDALGIENFSKEKITIGENEGYKISGAVEGKRGFSKALFTKEKVYLVETLFPKKCIFEECEIFNQMLSTFKFIK